MKTIFQKIIDREIPARIAHEDIPGGRQLTWPPADD